MIAEEEEGEGGMFSPKQCSSSSSSSASSSPSDISACTNNNHGSTKLRLLSPVGAEPAEYQWPLTITVGADSRKKKFNPVNEILETIRLVSAEFPDLKIGLENNVLSKYEPNSQQNIKLLCDKYNKVITQVVQMWKGTSVRNEKKPSTDLLHHIIQMCYNHSVGDPQKLNKCYEPFSPEVYGETSFLFVQQMIEQIRFSEQDVFIDLGSGVGQVVLHVAAAGMCKRCIGIEKANLPAAYAEKMGNTFKFWMNWFGKKYSPFELCKGDFLNDSFKSTIEKSSFIFVNNFVFGPDIDLKLSRMFESLPDGAKILSSKAFCPPTFRISNRNLDNIGAIMKVEEILPKDHQPVSWTGKRISYHLHTIDRARLERYFEEIQQIKKKTMDKKHRKENRKQDKSSPGSSSVSPNGDSQVSIEDSIPSKWTRKAWQEFTHTTSSAIISTTDNGISPDKSSEASLSDKEAKKSNGYHGISSKKKMKDKRSAHQRGRPKKLNLSHEQNVKDEHQQPTIAACNPARNTKELEPLLKLVPLDEESNETHMQRRRGRPKKAAVSKKVVKKKIKGINFSSLEMLHEKTMLSIDSKHDLGIRLDSGCVDQKLCLKLNNQATPSIVVMDQEMSSSEADIVSPDIVMANNEEKRRLPMSIDEHCLLYKFNLMRFNQYIKSTTFREHLVARIKQEQEQNEKLTETLNKLNTQVYEQKYQVIQAFKKFGAQTFEDLHLGKEMLMADNFKLEAQLEEIRIKTKRIEEQNLFLDNRNKIVKAAMIKINPALMQAASAHNTNTAIHNNFELKSETSTPDSSVVAVKVKEALPRNSCSIDSQNDLESVNSDNLENANLQMDMNRIPSMIQKAMVEPDVRPNVQLAAKPVSSGAKIGETKARRARKAKTETIKTTRKDSQVIMNMGGNGMPTTHVVHINKDKNKTKEAPKECETKRFPLKLKINCKSNSVAVLDARINESSEQNTETHKRKLSEDETKRPSPSYEQVLPAKKKNNNKTSNEVVENKIPPVRLKKSNSKEGGQYYHSVNDTSEVPRESSTTAASVEYSTLCNNASDAKPNGVWQYHNNTSTLPSEDTAYHGPSCNSSRSSSVDSSLNIPSSSSSTSSVKRSRRKNGTPMNAYAVPPIHHHQHHHPSDTYNLYNPRPPPTLPDQSIISSFMHSFAQQHQQQQAPTPNDVSKSFFNTSYCLNGMAQSHAFGGGGGGGGAAAAANAFLANQSNDSSLLARKLNHKKLEEAATKMSLAAMAHQQYEAVADSIKNSFQSLMTTGNYQKPKKSCLMDKTKNGEQQQTPNGQTEFDYANAASCNFFYENGSNGYMAKASTLPVVSPNN